MSFFLYGLPLVDSLFFHSPIGFPWSLDRISLSYLYLIFHLSTLLRGGPSVCRCDPCFVHCFFIHWCSNVTHCFGITLLPLSIGSAWFLILRDTTLFLYEYCSLHCSLKLNVYFIFSPFRTLWLCWFFPCLNHCSVCSCCCSTWVALPMHCLGFLTHVLTSIYGSLFPSPRHFTSLVSLVPNQFFSITLSLSWVISRLYTIRSSWHITPASLPENFSFFP